MDSSPEELIRFYCKRGTMENFVKESKNGFDFAAVGSPSKVVNANRLQVHALAYNIFNWFKRLALSAKMRKQQVDTIRLKLLKLAAKVGIITAKNLDSRILQKYPIGGLCPFLGIWQRGRLFNWFNIRNTELFCQDYTGVNNSGLVLYFIYFLKWSSVSKPKIFSVPYILALSTFSLNH